MEKIEWIDASEESPCNNSKCIVELSDGTYDIDYQYFGEWQNSDVVRWIDYSPELFNNLIKKKKKKYKNQELLNILDEAIRRIKTQKMHRESLSHDQLTADECIHEIELLQLEIKADKTDG